MIYENVQKVSLCFSVIDYSLRTLSAGIYANSDSENTGQNSAESTGRIEPPTRTVYHYYIAAYQNGDLLTCTGFGNAPYISRYTDGNSNSHFYQKWELVSSGTPGYYYIYPIGGDRPYALTINPTNGEVTTASVDTTDSKQLWALEYDDNGCFTIKVKATGTEYAGYGINLYKSPIKVTNGTKTSFMSVDYDTYSPPSYITYTGYSYIAPNGSRIINPKKPNGSNLESKYVKIAASNDCVKISERTITGRIPGDTVLTISDKITDAYTTFNLNVTALPNGVYMLRNGNSGYYARVQNGVMGSGTEIVQYEFDDSNYEKWQFSLDPQYGCYTIKSMGSSTPYYLTVDGNSSSIGAGIVLGTSDSVDGAKWEIYGTYTSSDSPYFCIKSIIEGEIILNGNGEDEAQLNTGIYHGPYSPSLNNIWNIIYDESDYTNLFCGTAPSLQGGATTYLYIAKSNNNRWLIYGSDVLRSSKNEVIKMLKTTTVFSTLTHGDQNSIDIVQTDGSIGTLTSADINALSSADFNNLKCVCLGACFCGQGGANADNLVNAFYNKGADFVLGFLNGTDIRQTNEWVKTFLNELANGNTYNYATRDADVSVRRLYENPERPTYTTDSRLIRGDINQNPYF